MRSVDKDDFFENDDSSEPGTRILAMIRSDGQQLVCFGVVYKEVAIPSPVQSGVNLPADLVIRKVLFENVTEELQRHRVVGLSRKRAAHLLKERNMRQHCIAEHGFPCRYVRFGKCLAARRQLDVTTFGFRKCEQYCRFDDGQNVVDFHLEFVGNPIKIILSTSIVE